METLAHYQEKFPDENIVQYDGRYITVPIWMFWYMIHRSGLVSRKHRHLKKRLKREIIKALYKGLESLNSDKGLE